MREGVHPPFSECEFEKYQGLDTLKVNGGFEVRGGKREREKDTRKHGSFN